MVRDTQTHHTTGAPQTHHRGTTGDILMECVHERGANATPRGHTNVIPFFPEGRKRDAKGTQKGHTLTATTSPFNTALCTCAMLPLAIGFLSNQSNTYSIDDRETVPVLGKSMSTNIKACSSYACGIEIFSTNPLDALTSLIGRPP